MRVSVGARASSSCPRQEAEALGGLPEGAALLDSTHLRAVITYAPLVLFELDPQGRFTLSEGSALGSLGLKPGEVVGRSLFELYASHPDILAGARRALAGEAVNQMVTVSGRVFEVTYTPCFSADGGLERVVGVAHDVTSLQRSIEARERSEARFRDFAEASSDWQWETDREHRFVALSHRVEEVLGFPRTQLLGLRRDEWRIGDPADDDWATHRCALDRRQPFRDFTYGARDAAGRRRVFRVSGRPVFDDDGLFAGYRGTGREVTAEVEAIERLRESEGRFRSLVTNLRDIIFCRGEAGGGDFGYNGSRSELFGVDAQRIAGTVAEDRSAMIATWYASIHPDDRPIYLELERRRKEEHEPYTMEYRISHPETGEGRWMREVAWVVEDETSGRTWLDSYILDITAEKRAAAALAESNERYRRLIEGAPVAILIYRGQRCAYVNPAGLALLGARVPAQMLGRSLFDLALGSSRHLLADMVAKVAGEGGPSTTRELVCRRVDGRGVPVELSAAAILEAGEPALQLVLVDLTARKRAEARMRHIAYHDTLTGLPNRLLLMDRLAHAIALARRERRQLALMILDLDGFKEVNDTLGHAAGDELLREIARRFRRATRASDTVARLGGDEFAIVQQGVVEARDAAALAGKIIDAVRHPCVIDGQDVRAGASIGISLFPRDGDEPGMLLKQADLALYRAKGEGRNRGCFFAPDLGIVA
jgi:diguanylate cyclase (GGDEF)-like protein/PAS domain S-box-containing protein